MSQKNEFIGPFAHVEAFRLMKYVGEKTGHIEWLWNSRDGVTPFMIGSPDNSEMMKHADWHEDVLCSNFVPPVGMRVFVDLTRERAKQSAARIVDRHWDDEQYPMSKVYENKRAARRAILKDIWKDRGEPDIVTVDEDLRSQFEQKAKTWPAASSPRR